MITVSKNRLSFKTHTLYQFGNIKIFNASQLIYLTIDEELSFLAILTFAAMNLKNAKMDMEETKSKVN